jgi:hypothetical protein
VLERVEGLGADVRAAVLVAGCRDASDLAVVGRLTAVVDLAGVGVEALDDDASERSGLRARRGPAIRRMSAGSTKLL